MKLHKNQIYSICVIIFAVIFIIMTSQLQSVYTLSDRDIGPRAFPYLAAAGLIVCAIGKMLTEGPKDDVVFTIEGWKRILIVFALIAGYLLAMTVAGYIVTTPIFSFLLVYAMKEDRAFSVWKTVLFSVLLTVVLYVVFQNIILVFLPTGILF